MSSLSPSLEKLIAMIAKLPGLGRKSASRIALYILSHPDDEARELAKAILDVKTKIHLCKQCSNLTEEEFCSICLDRKRDPAQICVVESPTDILRFERAGIYRGLYHVLGGTLSPLDGIGPETLRMNELFERVKTGTIKEVILALSPTTDGDATALYLMRELRERNIHVTRIARGVPVGADLEHVDEVTLARAMEDRTKVE